MEKFSVYNYENLSEENKASFNNALAQNLTTLINEIKNDDVLGVMTVEDFVASSGKMINAGSLVADLYSMITAGIQVGSGNQSLFYSVLNAFVEAWRIVE